MRSKKFNTMPKPSQVRNVPEMNVAIKMSGVPENSLPFPLQHDERRSPAATIFSRQPKRCHAIKAGQECVDRPAQIARPFAVDYPDLMDARLAALRQVGRDKRPHLPGKEEVQVEHAVDGELNGFLLQKTLPENPLKKSAS